MARPGGNPDLKKHGYKPADPNRSNNKLFAIKVDEDLHEALKAIDKDCIRQALRDLVDRSQVNT